MPETAADSPVESNAYDRLRDVQQAIQQALADGDTAQLIALTAEMNRLAMNLEAAPTEAPEPEQEVVMPPARSLAEGGAPSATAKDCRCVAGSGGTGDCGRAFCDRSAGRDHAPTANKCRHCKTSRRPERRAHVFRNRQVVVIGPEEQQNPLRTERASEMASEVPASTPQKKPEAASEVVAKKPVSG